MKADIKWRKLTISQELADFGWQQRRGLKVVSDKNYFVFSAGVIYGQKKIIIEVTNTLQTASPSKFSLTLIEKKVEEWSDGTKHQGSDENWRTNPLWIDFLRRIELDRFPKRYRKFFAKL